MLRAALVIAVAAMSSALTYLALDPRHWADATQEAILERVTAEYCQIESGSPERYIGRTGAAASIAVKAGLGPLAYAEVLKCKVSPSGNKN